MTIEKSSGNVYRDIGVADPESMLIKSTIAIKIGDVIKNRGLTQQRAAEIMGISQPNLSAMLHGRFRGITEYKMLEYLVRLGISVTISLGNDLDDTPKKIEIAVA